MVASIDIEEKPQLNLAYSVLLPERSLVIVCINNNLDPAQSGHIRVVVINLSSDDVYLLKGETMGFMQNQLLDISEIMTETSTEPSPYCNRG